MDNYLKQVVSMILQAADKVKSPDKVSRIYSVLMEVNMQVDEELRRIRDAERAEKRGL